MEQKLRFAPLIRVSTERQEDQGESLRVQTTLIDHWVEKVLNGTIPDNCREYHGQEHATPKFERQILDKLLADASTGKFDAIIVENISRWSRDNRRSAEGLDKLQANGIRFFVGAVEYDLFNNQQKLFLTMGVSMEEFHAKELARKGALGKISKAQRGLNPLGGKLPYGRTFDKRSGQWGIDPIKQATIKDAIARYLDEEHPESIPKIAATIGMDHTYLWRILDGKLGSDYKINITSRSNRIDETVIMQIPPLVDDDTIAAVKRKLAAKRTYDKGVIKYQHLLSRMIFCSVCGYALSSYPGIDGRNRYYFHQSHIHKEGQEIVLPCRFKHMVKATEIENAVLLDLVQTLGDPARFQKAIRDATPDMTEIDNLNREKDQLNLELKRSSAQIDKIVTAIGNGVISNENAKRNMDRINERVEFLNSRLGIIDAKIRSIPDPAQVKRLSVFTGKVFSAMIRMNPQMMLEKDFHYKQRFIKNAIGGKDAEGKKLGVYMSESDSGFTFEIRGILGISQLSLPLSDDYLIDAFHLDAEYQDIEKELAAIKSSLLAL